MHRVSELVGRPVVTNDGGERVGKTSDLLVSPDGTAVVGLVVSSGVLGGEKGVVPFRDVRSLGGDVIVANGREPVLDGESWHAKEVETIRSSTLLRKHVVTDDGRAIGPLKDVCVEEDSGRIGAYEVGESEFAGLIRHHRLIEGVGEVIIGPDLIIIPAAAVADPAESGAGTTGPINDPRSGPPNEPVPRTGPTRVDPVPGQPVEPRT